jgi:hypothetical protein
MQPEEHHSVHNEVNVVKAQEVALVQADMTIHSQGNHDTVARAVTQLKEFDGKKLIHVSKEGSSSRRRERRRSSARSYSEELINVCLSAMKNLLSKVI